MSKLFPHRLAPLVLTFVFLSPPAKSQILPDTTLGSENSVVIPNIEIKGNQTDLIEGGAVRGTNLFHSFTDFNVLPEQSVYFANPVGIDAILSRVTGSTPSNIFGTLGVHGLADLYLINPHGILFGADAQLDIEGSFYGTTATAVELGNDGIFSATDPTQSQLLAVNPNVSFWNYLGTTSGNVVNRGQLAIGGDLVLAGSSLDLEAQVAAAGDVSLLATDTVKIRDTSTIPFVGAAGNELTIQGNQGVDIVALGHPDSQLFSGSNMTLRSDGPVGGDTHYLSGGNFRIETLDSTAGELYSPIDPIIRSLGDVVIGEYVGTSLHILAGGSVTLDNAIIFAPDAGIANVDFLQETIPLSDDTLVEINGGIQPTLDVRAGVSPESIGTPPLQILTGFDFINDAFTGAFATETPTSADITVGDISINAPNGLILLTNQYQTNNNLTAGNILINSQLAATVGLGGIAAANFEGGSIFLDARDNITLLDSVISVPPSEAMTDSIVLLANETIQFDSPEGFPTGILSLAIPVTNNTGSASSVRVLANNIALSNGAQINTSTATTGSGGNISVEARETLSLDGNNPALGFLTSIGSAVLDTGNGGNVVIIANDLAVTNGAGISTSTLGNGNAGTLTLDINENTLLEGGVFLEDSLFSSIFSSFRPSGIASETLGTGQGGEINFNTGNLTIKDGAGISASSLGPGNAGNITLNVSDTAYLEGLVLLESDDLAPSLENIVENSYSPSGINSSASAEGAAGTINLNAGNLVITDGATIAASTIIGTGNAGSITLNIREDVLLEGGLIIDDVFLLDGELTDFYAQSSIASDTFFASGQDGQIDITATNLTVTGGAEISAETIGTGDIGGDAGSIVLNIRETASLDGLVTVEEFTSSGNPTVAASGINTETTSFGTVQRGDGGDIEINATDLVLTNGATLSASTSSNGRAGDIVLNITDTAKLDGAEIVEGTFFSSNGVLQVTNPGFSTSVISNVETGSTGRGGNVEINATNLEVTNGAKLSASTEGQGDAGDIILNILETARFDGATVTGEGVVNGVLVNQLPLLSGANSSVDLTGTGQGGKVEINAANLEVTNGAQLSTATTAQGDAGDILLNILETARFDGQLDGLFLVDGLPLDGFVSNANSSVAVTATGRGGDIEIKATNLEVTNQAALNAATIGSGNAGNIALTISDNISIDDGTIATFATDGANTSGGDIFIQGRGVILRNDGDILTAVDSGLGTGGNITITGDYVILLEDSDILAFSPDGRGGAIDLSQTTLFSPNLTLASSSLSREELLALDGNNEPNINATGGVSSGAISLNDASFIDSSLTQLPDNLVNSEVLVANSCIVRNTDNASTITFTGNEALSQQPGEDIQTIYSLGDIQLVPNSENTTALINEPHRLYHLADGRLIMSRECSSSLEGSN